MTSATVQLACDLIARPSVTPLDEGCQDMMIARLEAIGFRVDRLRYEDVDNFWAERGDSGPLMAFAGHTDVVPTGPASQWRFPPFEPTIEAGMLYGRGAAHERQPGGHGDGLRRVRRETSKPYRTHRLSHHKRRRRPGHQRDS